MIATLLPAAAFAEMFSDAPEPAMFPVEAAAVAGAVTERRRDPLTGEWRTFATSRQDRTFLPPSDQCPLCPTRDPSVATEVPW